MRNLQNFGLFSSREMVLKVRTQDLWIPRSNAVPLGHREFTESELIARCICDTRLKKKKIQWDTCFSQFPTIIISCKDNDVPLTGLWGGISWRRRNIQYSKWFVPWGNIGSCSVIVRVRDWVVLIELTLVMTSIKVVENSVSTMGNSPSQDYPRPDNQNLCNHTTNELLP